MTVRIVMAAILVALLAHCSGDRPKRGAVKSEVTREQEAERMFDAALRTMEKMGKVEHADPNQRLIYGVTRSGVKMEIEIVMLPDVMPDISVQANVPSGLPGGTIDEPERFMTLFRETRKSR